jgi:NodT family efflux transporter outer membrane factor (OMF) lipoprotein
MKHASARLATGSLVAILCGGCAVKPASPPHVDVPAHWVAENPTGTVAVTSEWFRSFGSEELDELVASAYRNNQDLAAADARVRQADARARAAGAALLPDVSAGGNGVFFAGHSPNGSVTETDYAALLSASYEVDFWGKNRAARMSARSAAEASESDQAVVALSMVTGVANTYFRLIAQRERVELAKQTLTNATQLLAFIEARRAANLSNPVELAQQHAVVAAAQVHVREVEQQAAEQEAALAILVGKMPGSVAVAAQHLADFARPRVSPGLPAELLARRPDVFTAEASLQAAHADLLRARAAFFPSISLTGTAGLANPSVAAAVQTLTGFGPTMSLGADVVQSIFNGGRLRAARAEAVGKEEEMLAQYRGAVLAAFWDVEVALSAIEHLDKQEGAQKDGVEQSERALTGARARYQAGSGDFLAVLEAQRSLVTAQEQFSQYQLARLQAAVGLCKALGGGWAQKH